MLDGNIKKSKSEEALRGSQEYRSASAEDKIKLINDLKDRESSKESYADIFDSNVDTRKPESPKKQTPTETKKPLKRFSRPKQRKQSTGANLSDEDIKRRNEAAHGAFLAARRAAQRGHDQSNTRIRANNDGVRISASQGGNKQSAQAARGEARRAGVIESPDKKKPWKGSTTSRYGSSVGADPYGARARAVSRKDKPKKTTKKSLAEIQSFLQGMLQITKENKKIDTSLSGNVKVKDPKKLSRESWGKGGRKFRQELGKDPHNEKNLEEGFGYLTNIKRSLNNAFNSLLDSYQYKYK